MARLNEAPAAADPLEALRRKFLRQNRDIARDNSTKSLRIRSLENEVSRLLAENLGFREQVAHLENEIGASKNRRIIEHVNTTKSRLETKLEEMMALVHDMKHVPATKRRISVEPRRAEARSPGTKAQRNMALMSEALADQEGRLPPILENKHYPRRTLDRTELLEIAHEQPLVATDSPDIGPPPVSDFVNADPVKIDLVSRSKSCSEDTAELEPAISMNLEQRRKRRESSGPIDTTKAAKADPATSQPARALLKTGAKRKMSVREDEELSVHSKDVDTSPDDFRFTRRTVDDKGRPASSVENPGNKTARDLAAARGIQRERKTVPVSSQMARKALESKTSNFDLSNSPKKAANAKFAALDEVAAAKNDLKAVANSEARLRHLEHIPMRPTAGLAATTIEIRNEDQIQVEPETPIGGLDMLSPMESAPSTARAESRDTPPPGDLGPGGDGNRPSRRARAAVSYAEPNLRDKMRRPTKDLVDAVTGEGKSSRASFINLDCEPPITESKIKHEETLNEVWKDMPAVATVNVYASSPLGNKTVASAVENVNREELRNGKISTLQLGTEKGVAKSASSSTISALIGRPKIVKQEGKEGKACSTASDKASLNIFDFNETSPDRDIAKASSISRDERPPSRTSRRASTALGHRDEKGSSDIDGANKLLAPVRRRQSTLGLESSLHNSDLKSLKSENLPKKSASHMSVIEEPLGGTRGERAAGRRRSMML